jgi:hypothetical protein
MKVLKITHVISFLILFTVFTGCEKGSTTTDATRDSYLGEWMVSESSTKSSYQVTITADPNSANGVLIACFANTLPTDPFAGAVVSGTTITLDENQVIGDGLKIAGSGSLSGKTITWNYTINDGADLTHVVAIYSKL